MRNMLAFLAALTLTFIGAGWYLDWFSLRSAPAPAGRRSVTVDFNTQKIGSDLLKAEQKIQQKINEKANADGSPAARTDKPAPSTPPAQKPQDLSIPGIDLTPED